MPIDIESAYRRYGPMVLRRCRRLLKEEASALDAMHDVFVQLLRDNHRLDDHGSASLLLRMATHQSLNRLRSRRRRPTDGDPEGVLLSQIASLESGPARVEARSLLARLFGLTPESTRTIAVLHLLDGLTLEEVAAEVGMSVSGVRKRLRGLRAQLPVLENV
ncbi:MAG: RNA polymerase sigma factor [Myxococcales bacterium]